MSSVAPDEFAVAPDAYIGKTLAGKYRVIRKLGGGGMGAVYEAEHTVIGRRVAVKVLHAQLASQETVVKRFVNEARAAGMIGHPNILDCVDIGRTDDGAPFLVLEFLEGHDLEGEIQKQGPLPAGFLVRVVQQAASAVGAAHAKGIVHRDLKPENLFLVRRPTGDPHVKVLDFGISKFATHAATSSGTAAGTALGTPYYMAPEQLRDASGVDHRADVYALGIILYQSLTTRVPFDSNTLAGLALEITTGTPPSLADLRPDVPAELVAVVMKAMARNPDDRYESMEALAAALDPFRGVNATPVLGEARSMPAGMLGGSQSRIQRKSEPPKKSRRTATPWIAAGLGLAAVGAVAGVLAIQTVKQAQETPPIAAEPPAAPVVTPPVVEPEPAVAPVVAEAPPQRARLRIESPHGDARAVVRGRVVTLPYEEDVVVGTAPETIEVTSPDREGRRYTLLIDEAKRIFATMPRGRGSRTASAEELIAALEGRVPDSLAARRPPAARPPAAAPAATPTPPPAADPPPRRPSNVYSGPSGDLPTL